MAFIIDTYAWIEYFKGSELGKKIKGKIEIKGNITPTIVLAEIKKHFTDYSVQSFDEKFKFIDSISIILPLDKNVAIEAGYIRSTTNVKNIGIVDCILLATAKNYNIKVLTGDKHFKEIKEAEYFGN